ncbi:MAG: hypothetical protein A2312_02050 [Candidatus Staskawiczbacteria bacterium RIFOXYB2_FULL_32_9]|uniref:Uncharacterized protein n=1 Tax=Candidatus Staskawiczbacteria bacterium RIFOXYD1_FULL_32_13 TaxID=1802234 RepID=A0A1G2JTV0_9BACT|nr:MAG: hypothetical protein UR22_C0022G0001 [Parcubacteria group bacterium GW2011_GWC2_32_10]OGZ78621.1 MAG: hypothetical protein A2360_01095 [Candidatus Staskawiczbacteria bacterium RIFOXYB1_FULL_32_11]OGZ81063.1 MAG: hypothetical protein A2312_02050 [Candidatus Staskawiczbacteria bacterium RIFOXYB2_FULL_32_9]OGZ86106.1 MAG: hypothetical protein A2463_02260 [Candidatus Staskawiczbacteria bacterium RIFOXYC2_FULL_32_10]OGZ89678.1 MAG: hypothetical protein A2561_00570 [Candidatus Staskawiczbacte
MKGKIAFWLLFALIVVCCNYPLLGTQTANAVGLVLAVLILLTLLSPETTRKNSPEEKEEYDPDATRGFDAEETQQ